MKDGIRERLAEARTRQGVSHETIAERLGITDMSVYDLEAYDGEVRMNLSLGQVCDLAEILGLSPRAFICGREQGVPPHTTKPAEVVEAIQARLSKDGIDPADHMLESNVNVRDA